MLSVVRKCPNCKPHEFQDKKYGKNMRVMNVAVKNNSNTYCCTVCGVKS